MKKRGIVNEYKMAEDFFPPKNLIQPVYTYYPEKSLEKKASTDNINVIRINSLLIGFNSETQYGLKEKLDAYFPNIIIKGKLKSIDDIKTWISTRSLDLIFIDSEFKHLIEFHVLCQKSQFNFEVIYITKSNYTTTINTNYNSLDYEEEISYESELLKTIQKAQRSIMQRYEFLMYKQLYLNKETKHSQKDIVGIPTTDGFEFMPINHIICCEGMQKCTNLITTHKKNILSSYNIGEFRKLLQPFGFFSPHKSFLINLSEIKKYHKEGTITMNNGQNIPLARRRKEYFMNLIKKNRKFPIIPNTHTLVPISQPVIKSP